MSADSESIALTEVRHLPYLAGLASCFRALVPKAMDHGWWVPSSDWFVSSDRVVSLRARPSRTWGFSAECLCLFVHICSVGSNPLVGAGFVLLTGWNIPQEISLACSAFHGHPYPEQACYCVLLEGSFIKYLQHSTLHQRFWRAPFHCGSITISWHPWSLQLLCINYLKYIQRVMHLCLKWLVFAKQLHL